MKTNLVELINKVQNKLSDGCFQISNYPIAEHTKHKENKVLYNEGDLTKNDNWSYSFGEETQESMTRRMLQLLNSGSYSSLGSDNSIPSDISFESDNSGYYHSQDGDRYSFDYSISNVYHKNEFPTIQSTGSKCDDLVESITLDRQYFGADFTMSNNRFVLKGTIKMNGPDMRVDISADVEDNETSKSDHLEWSLYKD